jgi:flagellar biosynthesis/type III secretory pathway M-ring protein FliF/YscJ
VIAAISQDTADSVIAAAGIVVGFVVLAIVGWIFWRAARRDQQAERDRREELARQAARDRETGG